MKKFILFFATIVVSFSAFAVDNSLTDTPLSSIPYTDGNTYSPTSPFTASGGSLIMIGNNSSYTGSDYWDLTNYGGIEFKFTIDDSYIGQSMGVRMIMVGASTSSDLSKTFTFTTNTYTLDVFFDEESAPSHKIWAIKVPWGVSGGYNVTVNSITALVASTSGVTETVSDNPNKKVNVYDLSGKIIRENVSQSDAVKGLSKGFYIVNHKKVLVTE